MRHDGIKDAKAIDLTRCYEASDRQRDVSRRTQALLAAAGMDAPARKWFVITVENGMDRQLAGELDHDGVVVVEGGRHSWLLKDPETLPAILRAEREARRPARAKNVIFIWQQGGPPHQDMWDMKPEAPLEYRGEFKPMRTTGDDIVLCEHLPLLAKQAHRFAMIHGVTDGGRATGDHHAGYCDHR